ncbi:hypothetical protein Q0M94_00395 [Deinococcus radiomollis]|uniref:hypothetical protein n=1 Tax=Deinococcus radiomollis TaxID=468916 RepID=UPI0038911DAF
MDWQAALNTLRPQLPRAREAWGVRGSLRWLEEAMRAQGANPSSVRNIVYRDIGTAQDKLALHGLLSELASQVGQTLAPLPVSLRQPLPTELELLGRQKRRAFRQFLASVRQSAGGMQGGGGPGARLIVTGPPGAGKTLLNTHLERAIGQLSPAPRVRRLTLGGDLTLSGDTLSPGSGVFPDLEISASQPYAVQAEAQARAAKALLNGLDGVLLLRVERSGEFGGVPPRSSDGAATSLTAWAAEHLYRRAPPGLSVLLAAEDAQALPSELPGDRIRLAPPTPAEARRYLMAQLGIPADRADELARQTGRNLDRLTLLAAARTLGSGDASGEDTLARLLADPAASGLLSALSVTQDLHEAPAAPTAAAAASTGQSMPRAALEAALGRPLTDLPAHVRALLDETDPDRPRPRSVALLAAARPRLPAAEVKAALTRLAAGTAQLPELAAVHLGALSRLGRWAELTRWFDERPGGLAQAPAVWENVRGRVRGEAREALARVVVSHHAMRGAYGHPQARDALFALLDSPRTGVRAWARVKLAESSVDSGNFEAAQAQLSHPELHGPLAERLPDRWLQGAQADALLVGAALARWQGDLDTATRLAADPRTLSASVLSASTPARQTPALQGSGGQGPGVQELASGRLSDPARAALWRGLIAKDAGRWTEAMRELGQVPAEWPLLSARARYQEGDLRLRLGQPAAALRLLQDAARRLRQENAAPEEQARAGARIATALRRLGQPQAALEESRQASALAAAGDAVLRARLYSERIPVLLALFRPDEALGLAAATLELLSQPGPRRAEAAYRERRTHYRIALAYLTRGAGQPYLQPFSGVTRDTPDSAQARQLLDTLLDHTPLYGQGGELDREQVLSFDILLSRALTEPEAGSALNFARRALDMTDHPYAETQARATLAEAHLRAGQHERALHETNRAHALLRRVATGLGTVDGLSTADGLGSTEAPDPGLHALLLTLEARCTLAEADRFDQGGAVQTLHWLRDALNEEPLRPFCAQVWREVGAHLEGLANGGQAALAVFPGLRLDTLRLRDALSVAASSTSALH